MLAPLSLEAEEGETFTEPCSAFYDEMLYLDPRVERAVMRDTYLEAATYAARKPDVILVRLRSARHAELGAARGEERVSRQGDPDVRMRVASQAASATP